MIFLYRSPELAQAVGTPCRSIWGFERHNLGYRGPICRVRRASDNAERDCYSQPEISAFCVGTTGTLRTIYDQGLVVAGSELLTTLGTPPVFEAGGLVRDGNTIGARYDGTAKSGNGKGDQLPGGSPALTSIVLLFGLSVAPAQWRPVFYVGGVEPGSGWGLLLANIADGRKTNVEFFQREAMFGGNVDTARHYFVVSKPADQPNSSTQCREDGVNLPSLAINPGTQNCYGGPTYFACHSWTGHVAGQFTAVIHGHWTVQLVGNELVALEQYLERMRVQ